MQLTRVLPVKTRLLLLNSSKRLSKQWGRVTLRSNPPDACGVIAIAGGVRGAAAFFPNE